MVTLENKCTLISMFDALAFQYPNVLKNKNINTPLDLVQVMLEGEGSNWGLKNDWVTSHKKRFKSNEGGHPVIYPFLCCFLEINMCVDRIPNLTHTKDYMSSICPSSQTVLNICSEGENHVEFHPFPYVRTRENQELYELYSKNSQEQIKKFEWKKIVDEEHRATMDLINMDDDLLDLINMDVDLLDLTAGWAFTAPNQ